MWATVLHHTKMVEELAVLQAVVSSVVELVLGHSPDETSSVGVMNKLVATH
jgi:hypothetical protein